MYVVVFNDLDTDEMIFIAKSLREIFVFAKGIINYLHYDKNDHLRGRQDTGKNQKSTVSELH